ncbi:MAG: hypothetical protein ACREOI_14990 [bacterium]
MKYEKDEFLCPEKVEREIRRSKSQNHEILRLFQEGVVAIKKVGHYVDFASVSDTDAEVISLAIETQSTIISDDAPLRENANRYGVSAIDVAGFVLLIYQQGRMNKNECSSHLTRLFKKKILSKPKYHQLLTLIRP